MNRKDVRKRPSHPAHITAAIKSGVVREIPRSELPDGSWQQAEYDKGRSFYGPPLSNETIPKPLTVHEHATELAKQGRALMVFVQSQNQSIPYEQYAAETKPQLEAVTEAVGPMAVGEAAAA